MPFLVLRSLVACVLFAVLLLPSPLLARPSAVDIGAAARSGDQIPPDEEGLRRGKGQVRPDERKRRDDLPGPKRREYGLQAAAGDAARSTLTGTVCQLASLGRAATVSRSIDGGLTFDVVTSAWSAADPALTWNPRSGSFHLLVQTEKGLALWRSSDDCQSFVPAGLARLPF